MDIQELEKDYQEFEASQRKYYSPTGIMDAVLAVSSAEYAIKYLLMCNEIKGYEPLEEEPEFLFPNDAELLNFDLLGTLSILRSHCAEYIDTFDMYSKDLEKFAGDN